MVDAELDEIAKTLPDCPFCHIKPKIAHEVYMADFIQDEEGNFTTVPGTERRHYRIRCPRCGIESYFSWSLDGAIDGWKEGVESVTKQFAVSAALLKLTESIDK